MEKVDIGSWRVISLGDVIADHRYTPVSSAKSWISTE